MAADARQTDPLAAAAPARLEAIFLPCPEVECIGKGKANASYEFGVKASITTTNVRAPGGVAYAAARRQSLGRRLAFYSRRRSLPRGWQRMRLRTGCSR